MDRLVKMFSTRSQLLVTKSDMHQLIKYAITDRLLMKRRLCECEAMVLCIISGCSSKSGRDKDIRFFRVPKKITNQGEEYEEWISAISFGDTDHKNVLESERVCGKHFVFGERSPVWNQFHVDWVPTLNLGNKKYVEKDFKQVAEKAERAKKRRQQAIERAELEAAEK